MTLPFSAQAAVSLSKNFLQQITGPLGGAETPVTIVSRGDVITLRIDVANGGGALTAGELTDNLPTGMVLAQSPNPRATTGCGAGIVLNAVPGGTTFSYANASVPALSGGVAGRCSVYVDVQVPLSFAVASNSTETLNNTIPASTGPGVGFRALESGSLVVNTDPVTRSLLVESLNNLAVSKTFSPSTVNMGENTTLNIVIANPNSVSVGISQLTENLPSSVVANNTTPVFSAGCASATASATGTSGNVNINFSNLTLGPNASCTLSWSLRAVPANNTTSTSTNIIPANSALNSRSLPQPQASADVTVQSPLYPTKGFVVFGAIPAAANQPVAMEISLFNRSTTQNLANANFIDNLPAGMTLSPGAITSTNCGSPIFTPLVAVGGETTLSVANASIAANSVCRVTAYVQVSIPGFIINTIPTVNYQSDNPFMPGSWNTSQTTGGMRVYDQLGLYKEALDPRFTDSTPSGTVGLGNLVRYRLNLSNYASVAQNGLTLTDPLPVTGGHQVVFLTSPPPTFSNCGSPSVVSANGASSAQFTNINIPGTATAYPASCLIEFYVQVPPTWPAGTDLVNGTDARPLTLTQGVTNVLQTPQPNTPTPTVIPFALAKSVAATLFQGDTAQVTLTIGNNNYVDMSAIDILDSPLFASTGANEVVLAAAPEVSTTCGGSPVWTAVPGSTSLRVQGLSLAARSTCTVSFRVRGVVPGSYMNTIPVNQGTASVTINGVPAVQNPGAAATSPLQVQPALTGNKFFTPNVVSVQNGISRVTVQLNNASNRELTGVQVTDPLSGTGLVVAAPPNASTTCDGSPVMNVVAGANTAQLQGARIGAGGACLFQFDVRTDGSLGTAPSVNTIPAGGLTADGGIYSVTPVSATLNKVVGPNVVVTKSFNPSTLTGLGQTSRLQLTIDNTQVGSVALTNLSLTDNLSLEQEGMVVASTPAASTNCPAGVVSAVPGATTVSVNGATLDAGAICVFSANVTLITTGSINNIIPVSTVKNDQAITNVNQFTANLTTQSALGVDKSFNPTAVAVNVPSRLTIRLFNPRAVTLRNLSMTDPLPPGLSPANPPAATTTCTGGVVTTTATQVRLTNGNLSAASGGRSAFCEVSLNVVATSAGTYTNEIPSRDDPNNVLPGVTATAGNNGEGIENQHPAVAVLQVRSAAQLSKAFASPSVLVGQSNRLTVTVSNPNAIALTGVVLTDNLPTGAFIATTPNPGTTCTGATVTAAPGGTSVRLTGATVPANGSCTFAVDTLSNIPGVYVNNIPANALTTAEGVTNTAPATATFVTIQPPTLGKEFNPVQIPSAGTSKLRIVLGNPNATDLTMTANLDDTLPVTPGVLGFGAPALDTTSPDPLPRCAGASTLSSPNVVRVASGTVIPPGGCVVVANVTGTATGIYNNVLVSGALQTSGGNNAVPATANLSISTRNSISGKVYQDSNNNGVLNAGESGINGQSVELLNATGTVIATSATDSLGNYAFLDLPDATYTVRQPNQPAGTVNGITSVGTGASSAGTASSVSTTPSVMSSIVLSGGGQNAVNYHFGELLTVSLAGRVWLDVNNNGVIDGHESGLASVALNLSGTHDLGTAPAQNLTTDAEGYYSFANLRPGTYSVTQPTQPAGTANGLTVVGSAGGTATPITTLPSAISNIVLTTPGTASTGNNFGELSSNGALRGRMWFDSNENGVIDGGEIGIAGETVVLTGADLGGVPVSRTVTTDANGDYVFSNVSAGTYTVTQPNQPAGTLNGTTLAGTVDGVSSGTATGPGVVPSAVSGIVLPMGRESVNNNFGEIGDPPNVVVSKSHTPTRFSLNATGTYTVTVRNIGRVPTSGLISVTDRLPAGLSLNATPTGAGWSCTGAAGASSFVCTTTDVLAANATSSVISVRVNIAATTAPLVHNAVLVEGGGEPVAYQPDALELHRFNNEPQSLPLCDPAITHNACRDATSVQSPGALAGTVWYDTGSTMRQLESGDRRLSGWIIEVVDDTNQIIASATSGSDGTYRIDNLSAGTPLSVRFREPKSGVLFRLPVNGESGTVAASCDPTNAVLNGTASSCVFGDRLNPSPNAELRVVLSSGQTLGQQSLPVDPSGVVYNAVTRLPVPDATVTLRPSGVCAGYNPGAHIQHATSGGYTVNGNDISMTVGDDGLYEFYLLSNAPASCAFQLTVTPPAGSDLIFRSTIFPPTPGPLNPGVLGNVVRVQPQGVPPTGGEATTYYLDVLSGSATGDVVHNHIPLDPPGAANNLLTITKTGDRRTVEVGDTLRYTISVRLNMAATFQRLTIVDRLPPGFSLIRGTAQIDGVALSDAGNNPQPAAGQSGASGPSLAFNIGPLTQDQTIVLTYRVRVGAGAMEGDGINRATAHACSVTGPVLPSCVTSTFSPVAGALNSAQAQYRVRVTGGVFTTEACVLGKIFVDCNHNHRQDAEELGIPGVRFYLQNGTYFISDSEGKYSMCGLTPNSHVLKADTTTLPRGSRLTTSSNRHLGDAGSLWLDLKNGELHRADFIEGSCSNAVLEQVKARRAQGEVRAPEVEKKNGNPLRFESKPRSPQQGTDAARQPIEAPRYTAPSPLAR